MESETVYNFYSMKHPTRDFDERVTVSDSNDLREHLEYLTHMWKADVKFYNPESPDAPEYYYFDEELVNE